MTTKIEKTPDPHNPKALRTVRPVVDIYDGESDCKVVVELPGVAPDAVVLAVEQDTLTLSAERAQGVVEPFVYERAFALPNTVDHDKIGAELKVGVLTLTLPKNEAAKPKRIAVNAA